MSCINCARDFHFECGTPCCCPVDPSSNTSQSSFVTESTEEAIEVREVKLGRPPKRDDEIGTSAGRKRAAIAYTIDEESQCEWRALSNCGGGLKPIVGCLTGKQKHRHHGPIKDTSHNESINIHRICTGCHNTWHAKNDPVYDEEKYKLLPHSPRPMNPMEMLESR